MNDRASYFPIKFLQYLKVWVHTNILPVTDSVISVVQDSMFMRQKEGHQLNGPEKVSTPALWWFFSLDDVHPGYVYDALVSVWKDSLQYIWI